MKKHGLRIAFFILSFSIGIGLVWLLNLSNFTGTKAEIVVYPSIVKVDPIPVKTRSGDIEIRFKEFGKTDVGFYADVEVLNPETEPVFFYDGSSNNEDITTLFEPRVKVGGKEAMMMTCGTGTIRVEKKLGYSKTYRIYLNYIVYFWEKGKSFQIGLYFKKSKDQEYKPYWSENLPITDDIAKQLLKDRTK